MAEHNPIYIPDATTETIQYKPLSLLAIAGLVLAVLFTIILALFVADAWSRGQPIFLPGLLLLLPLGGIALSLLGLWEIKNSEGTRAGRRLAVIGFWLSLLAGGGYFTMQTVTGMAIIQQSNRFMTEKDVDSGFFPRLQSSDVDARTAFLFTLGKNERSGVSPLNERDMEQFDMPNPQSPKGLLARFMESSLVRAVRECAPGSLKVEPGAVKDWTYDAGAYKISRTYQVTTDDGVWEVPMQLTSIEPEAEGEKRKWRVDWNVSAPLTALNLTEKGKTKQGLRRSAYAFLAKQDTSILENLRLRRGLEVYLMEQRPLERKELQQRAAALEQRTPLVALLGASLPAPEPVEEEKLRQIFLPRYVPLADFAKPEISGPGKATLDLTGLRTFSFLQKELPTIRAAAVQAFSQEKLPMLAAKMLDEQFPPITFKDGEVTVIYPFEVSVPSALKGESGELKPVMLKMFGRITVSASDKLNYESASADQEWRVVSIALVRAVPVMGKQ
jgi:hypothetical protein